MTDTPMLDDLEDFERDIVRTLQVKADQLAVDDRPFDAEARPVVALRRSASPLASRRRTLALAAAVALLGGAVGAARWLGPSGDGSGPSGPDAVAAAPVHTTPDSGPAAFLPATVPDGWTLRQVSAGQAFDETDTTWQLFGEDGPSPLDRGVLVSSASKAGSPSGRVVDGESVTFGAEPIVGPSADPLAPAGTLEASWLDGDLYHSALSRGLSEDELRAFVASLVSHDDPTTGFETPTSTGLVLVETSVVEEQYISMVTYTGPAGDGDTVRVTAEISDRFGGLLHRLVGEPGGDGIVIRGSSGDPDYPFVSRARQDGWTVEVLSQASPTVASDPAVLDAFLDSLRPVMRDLLVDVAAAEPVTATGTAGDWSVEVHGSDAAAVALCLAGDGGDEVCTTADSWLLPGMVSGSVLVGDQWVVVAVHDATIDPMVSADVESHPGPPYPPENRLSGARGEADDGRVVEVFTVPAATDTVAVTVFLTPDARESEATEFRYERPPG